MKKSFSRVLSAVLCLAMFAGLVPVATFAAETSNYSLAIASKSTAQLAPGVTETTVVSYDSNGDRVQYFVVNANIVDNDTVQVKANYHDNDNTGVWGKATVVEQANAAKEKRGYNVVAITNASYYNVTTGQPTGAFVMEGVNINGTATGNNYPFFAILDDGTAVIGAKGEFGNYADHVVEAIGGYRMLVQNGAVVSGLDSSSKYPRSTVGITAEGNVVMLLADGNNKPYSAGLTYAEQAQLMLEQGCVAAVELDGGGSATYAAKLEGSDEIEVRNVCCDGTVRSVSNTLMVISTAVADGTFDHANLSTKYAYYAANSEAVISVVGADASGAAADIPENVSWTLSDDSFGTIADGVFQSNGTLGTVTAQMLVADIVVGAIDITVVNPTSIAFAAAEKTVPYGRTSDFSVTSMYNGAEVYAPAEVFDFTETAGEMNGFIYTAPDDESIASAVVTATYKYAELDTISVSVIFGKGSEVLFDFEGGEKDLALWTEINGLKQAEANGTYTKGFTNVYGSDNGASNFIDYGIQENVFLATEENGGKVHSGKYSLGYTLDYTQSESFQNWQYSYLYYIGDTIKYRDTENGINGTRIGMWMYIPEEAVGSCARLAYTYKTAAGSINTAYLYFTYQYVSKGFSKLTSAKIPEAGWAYVYCDLDDISTTYATTAYYTDDNGAMTRAAATNYAPAFIQFIVSSSASGAEKCTFYIDDITLDYSDVVDDRDAPIISNPLALDDLNSYSLDGRTLSVNVISVSADAVEDTSHGTNFTGIDASTAAVYVDGQKIDATYSAGKIATKYFTLPNGTHDISFEIADKQGNYTKLTKQIVINTDTTYPVVTLEGQALAEGNVKTGAQYNLLVKTDKAEAIDTVETTIWLNSASKWALEHMETLDGFEVTYTLDELSCMATIKVSRVDSDAEGAATLVTIPVYAWSWDGTAGHDAHTQWTTGGANGATCPVVTISYKVKYGEVTYTDKYAVSDSSYIAGFSNKRADVATELTSNITNLKNTIGEWHYHTEVALNDVAATCTKAGYTGRTVCSVCNSVVDWGTVMEATGHTYEVVDGKIICSVCGEAYTGTGLVEIDGKIYYTILGELKYGWLLDSENNYRYFGTDGYSLTGVQTIGSTEYTFDDSGVLIRGSWAERDGHLVYHWAGRRIYSTFFEIDGKTYYFNNSGYMQVGPVGIERNTYSGIVDYYVFNDDGTLVDDDGIVKVGDTLYYVVDSLLQKNAGLINIDGDYYYVRSGGNLATDSIHYCSVNMTEEFPIGYYAFDANGKLVIEGIVAVEGTLYYYKDGVRCQAGLIQIGEDYYYVRSGGKVTTGTYYCSYNMTEEFPVGYYTFDSEGKMIIEEKNGIVSENGALYYYENDVRKQAGLIQIGEDYYYVRSGGRVATGTYYCTFNMTEKFPAGYYTFDTDGRMIID